jgi:BirA family transcriptional regulator, biotin operon repressor / biotin---[acetyl-CoA-carboxylase] ligase
MDKKLLLCLNAGTMSGVAIAKRLGISRSAVWKQIENLRRQGVEITAIAGKGYSLNQPIEFLQKYEIINALSQDTKACLGQLHIVDQTDSTNTWAQQTPLMDVQKADIFLAEQQLAGRGRRGRRWSSPFASNIYLSIHRRFDVGLAALSGLSLVVGLMVAKALRENHFHGIGVKWPNDIWADQKKCGGILIEVQGDTQGPVTVTIGVGLNVRMPISAGLEIDQDWTDLQHLSPGRSISRNSIVSVLLNALLPAMRQFEIHGAADFLSQWSQYDVLLNKSVRVLDGTQQHHGTVLGVTEHGALRLLQEGTERQYHSGEISVRTL